MRHPIFFALTSFALFTAARATPGGDYPPRRPGEWQLTSMTSGSRLPPRVQRVCLDAQTDALLYRLGLRIGQQACSRFDLHRSGNKVEVDSVCRLGPSQSNSHSVITFNGDTAYRDETTVHFDPPLGGKTGESTVSTDAKWLGPCPDDMKPGDIVSQPTPLMPAPLRMNLREMLGPAG